MQAEPEILFGVPSPLRQQATALYCEALQAKLRPFLGPVDRATAFLAGCLRPDRAFVAVERETVLGIAGFQHNGDGLFDVSFREIWRAYGWSSLPRALGLASLSRRERRDTLLMDGIAVTASARGRGIGSTLLNAVAGHALALGKRYVRLDVIDTNPRARRLYERRGFVAEQTSGIGPFRLIFPFKASTRMRKRLTPEM